MKALYICVAALVAGFLGGILGARVVLSREAQAPARLLRARGFELVDESGQVISYWGIDKANYAVLAFGNHWPPELAKGQPHPTVQQSENQMLSLGVHGDGPFFAMRAPDGKPRVRLYTDFSSKKPLLMMDDESGPRISLGTVLSDTAGGPENDWALQFDPDRASIGMYRITEGGRHYVRGTLSISKDKVADPSGESGAAK